MRIWALTGIVGNGRTLRSENRVQANDVAKAKMATMTASGRALSARLPQTGFPCAANGFVFIRDRPSAENRHTTPSYGMYASILSYP